jgi:hypothetical protein
LVLSEAGVVNGLGLSEECFLNFRRCSAAEPLLVALEPSLTAENLVASWGFINPETLCDRCQRIMSGIGLGHRG